MTERAPSSVLKWLDQVEVPQSVLDLEQSSDEAATPLGDSLENLLCKDEFANCGIPECIRLPESRSSFSTDSHDSRDSVQVNYSQSDEDESIDSLEILGRCDTPIIPSHIQLPVSRPSSTARERREKKDASRRQSRKKSVPSLSYEEMLQRAADAFDHIKSGNVLRDSRINKTNIIYYDYWTDHMSNPIEVGNSKNATQLHIIPPDVKQRVILVEDLSRDTIHALGSAFRINPDFFEEHLLDSGYSGAQYHDPPARTWKTAPLKKSHVSIKWFRPVHRLPALFSSRDRVDLLNGQLEHAVGRSTIRTRAKTNIFRSEWDLWTDPRRSARSRRECGLEERATIWSRKMEDTNCQVVVMLLDPLPLISEKETWTLQAAESNGSADAGNIDSDEEDNYDDDEADYGDSYDGHDDDSHRAVILEASESDEVDVLDEGVLHMLYEGDNTIEPQRVSADPTLWNRFFISFKSRGKRKTLSKTEQRVLVEQMAPRKAMTADLDEAFGTTNLLEVLRRELNETRSTRTEICDMIDTSSQPVGLGKPIFEIIRQDTSTLLQLLHHILGEMEVDTLDDNKMEDRLALWRQLIGRARRELPEFKDSIQSFLAFFDVLCPPVASLSTAGNHPNVTKGLHDLSVAIDEMLDRLQKASESLTSNMALLESRRSIDEAHAVTRLTELAFIFVPLSFAASVFGMQVEPFADPVPLWNFFLVAVIVTSFAYMMRITMRSQWLGYVKLAVKQDIRQYAEQNGLPIQVRTLPVLLLLRWAGSLVYGGIRAASTWAIQQGRRAGKQIWDTMGFLISLCLLIGLVAVIPISVLWTRKLDHDMQVGVTIAVLLIAALIVGIPYCYTADPGFCYALPRLIVKGFRRIPKSVARLTLWLFTLVAIIVVPLALIWTHPLASGIRAGLTAAIVIVVIMGIVTFRLITYYG